MNTLNHVVKKSQNFFLKSLMVLRTHPNSTVFKGTKDLEPTLLTAAQVAEKSKNAVKIMTEIKKILE